LQYYASRGALDIDTLGEKNVVALVDAGLVNDIADIYTLTVDDLIALERFGNLSSEKLISAIQASKAPKLEKFILALGIRHVGAQTAIDLADTFKGMDELQQATLDQLTQVEGVGKIVAESIVAWFADEDNMRLLAKFESLGVQPVYAQRSGVLTGKSFVITGSLTGMGRDEAAERIRAKGGVFQSAVAKDTTYLVAGGKVGASKLKKAEQYGVQIIDEQQLLELLED
jgi:DNA ligase (NAD+)